MTPFTKTFLIVFPAMIASANPSAAATLHHFTITVETIPEGTPPLSIGDVFYGQLSYSAVIPTTGAFTLDPTMDCNITLTFDFVNEVYTHLDDEEHPAFPKLYFLNGILRGISFEAVNKSDLSLPEGYIAIESSNDLFYSFDGNGEYAAKLNWSPASPVPEPSSVVISATLLSCGLWRRRPH